MTNNQYEGDLNDKAWDHVDMQARVHRLRREAQHLS